jgi:branched-chain amino acid transport system permease protein
VSSLGGGIFAHRVALYTLSGGIAGLAGALSAQTVQVVGLNTLSVTYSAEILVMLVMGGTGRLWGALLGALVFMMIHHYAAEVDPVRWMLFIGAMLVMIVLFLPKGLFGGLEAAVNRLREGART